MLTGKSITLGVTACSAVDKVPELIRRLRKLGAEVRVVMTPNATQFTTPLLLRHASGNPVSIDQFAGPEVWDKNHKPLAQADLLLIAPASADTLGKAANGLADNLLTATLLSADCPIVFATHINPKMYGKPSVQRNVTALKEDGYTFVEAHSAPFPSAMPTVDEIIDTVLEVLGVKQV